MASSSVSHQLHPVQRRLTASATIFLPFDFTIRFHDSICTVHLTGRCRRHSDGRWADLDIRSLRIRTVLPRGRTAYGVFRSRERNRNRHPLATGAGPRLSGALDAWKLRHNESATTSLLHESATTSSFLRVHSFESIRRLGKHPPHLGRLSQFSSGLCEFSPVLSAALTHRESVVPARWGRSRTGIAPHTLLPPRGQRDRRI